MNKNILMAMLLAFVAVAPVGAAQINNDLVSVSQFSNEAVDCFYDQNRYLPECKKK